LAKSSIFVVSGRILAVDGTTQIGQLRSMLAQRSGVAIPFLAAMAALLGMPPFALFFTEVAIVVAGFQRGLGWVMAVAIVLLLVAFVGLARHTSDMMFGRDVVPDAGRESLMRVNDRSSHGPRIPLIAALTTTAVIGFLAGPFSHLLTEAASVLGGGR
jgi:hydrogenase-4 component F